ncbi:hypothetical protein GHT06_001864 [Daphnia sinensis]|uniref:Uncharacterized protein n=1 Tax=Daphnia sinensis TaxID=1820382 RepID=A0AAD5PLT1_9CRUS|nr:hypothetical protein GHT06_001864 [Daphnia sinensis]
MDRNAYYAWVKTIAPYMKSNPYLPRVYVVDDRTDARGSKNPRYKMEKLYSPSELSMDALLGMAEKIQGDGAVDEDVALSVYNTYYHGEFETEEIAFEKFKLWFWKEHVVNLDFLHKAAHHDDNLKQAFDLEIEMSKMSELEYEIIEMLEKEVHPVTISLIMGVPVDWVYEVSENLPNDDKLEQAKFLDSRGILCI